MTFHHRRQPNKLCARQFPDLEALCLYPPWQRYLPSVLIGKSRVVTMCYSSHLNMMVRYCYITWGFLDRCFSRPSISGTVRFLLLFCHSFSFVFSCSSATSSDSNIAEWLCQGSDKSTWWVTRRTLWHCAGRACQSALHSLNSYSSHPSTSDSRPPTTWPLHLQYLIPSLA